MAYLNKKTLYRLMGLDFSSNQTQTLDGFLSKVSPTSDASLLISEWKKGGISGNTTIRSLLGNKQNYGILNESLRTINSLFRVENHNSVNNTFNDFVEPKVEVGGVFVDGEYSQGTEGTGAVLEMSPQISSGAVIGLYTNISPTGGSGTGLVVDVEIIEDRGVVIASFTIVNGGTGYQVLDEVTIPISEVGGTTGEIMIQLLESQVDESSISSIRVTPDEIILDSDQISITGNVIVDGNISNVTNITTGVIQAGFSSNSQLLVNNPFGTTVINFSNLPTSDPQTIGQLWVDTANGFVLKVSQGE